MNPKPSVRIAEPKDSARVTELLDQLGYRVQPALVQEKLSSYAEARLDRVFVVEVGGEVVGLLSFHVTPLLHEEQDAGRITALVVDEAFRGWGIGAQLVETAEAWAWLCGCSKIEVTSGDHRPDAHRFYESRGYQWDERRFLKSRPNRHDRKEISP